MDGTASCSMLVRCTARRSASHALRPARTWLRCSCCRAATSAPQYVGRADPEGRAEGEEAGEL